MDTKPQWTAFSTTFAEFNNKLAEFVEGITDSKTMKAARKLTETWNKVVRQQNEFDKLVEPIRPIALSMPYPSAEFSEMWKTYKEYLLEDHNAYMGSRRENELLKFIKVISAGSERQAIEIIAFLIRSGYKSIFKPSAKQLAGEEPAKVEAEQSFDPNKKVTPL